MKTRIDVIAGYLGAGKTTLILQMAAEPPEGQKIAICENEYGEVGLDGDEMKGRGLEVLEINAGCVCCTLSLNLVAGVKLMIALHRPDRILLEPTGLASLSQLLEILRGDGLENVAEIGAAALVMDGSRLAAEYARNPMYFESQLAAASVVFLNRTGAMGEAERAEALRILHAANPDAAVLAEPYSPGELWEALDSRPAAAAPAAAGFPKAWLRQFDQLAVDAGRPGSRERFEELLARPGEFGEIVRAKGFARDAGGARYRLDVAGGAYAAKPAEEGGADALQLIGRRLKKNIIKNFFG